MWTPRSTIRVAEVKLAPLADYQKAAIFNPFEHFVFWGSVGAGKTFVGSHWCIKNRIERPKSEFFVGANSYDQLSQATLAELFYWLHEYGFEFAQDKRPPTRFGNVPQQKNYHNTLTIYDPRTGNASLGFTRILSGADNLRGIEFEDYWIDEARDTQRYTHDMILGRQRGYERCRGLVTTTTNGEDWVYRRFLVDAPKDSNVYGSMHVTIDQAIHSGVLTQKYKQTLLASYSPLMAEQELFAKHVNVLGGRAYYSAGDWNRMAMAPWGDRRPDPNRPLIVGCDFNFQPSPCVWMVGQLGPEEVGPNGEQWWRQIHWFREIASVQTSTPSMAIMLLNQFPGFFYRIFGDASGRRGTTSNAGVDDYNQIANTMADHGAMFTIDVEPSNPLVKDRIENMNSLFKNAMGEIRQTYDPSACPLFDGDTRMVGWRKQITLTGQGKLDTMDDPQRTHATDGAGYAVYKLFPPGRKGRMIDTNRSAIRQSIMDEIDGNNIANPH